MSDVVKLNIRSKGIKAIISEDLGQGDRFLDLPKVLEREKQEHAHKIELENEFQRGYQKGREEATSELEKKHSEDLLNQSKDFYNIISSLEEKFSSFEKSFHKMVIHISGKIAEKVLSNEFKYDSTVEKILVQNLGKIIGANDIIIKLNPKDYELIQKSNKEYLGSSGITKIKFESNENIQLGGCLVESEIGNLDARVESRISELLKALENNYLNEKSE